MIALIVAAVVLAVLLLAAWSVDRHDRREGRTRKNAKQLGADIRAARRAQRAQLGGRGWLPKVRPDRSPQPGRYVAPDGTRRPVKRGQ